MTSIELKKLNLSVRVENDSNVGGKYYLNKIVMKVLPSVMYLTESCLLGGVLWNLEAESCKQDVQQVQSPKTEMSNRAIMLLAGKQG